MKSKLLALVKKDIETELRRKTNLWVQGGFTLASAVLVASAASSSQSPGETAGSGILLVSLFLSLYASYSTFIKEAYKGTLDGLRAAPVDRWMLVASKLLLGFLLLFIELILFSIILVLFGSLSAAWGALILWIGATSLFLASVSSFVSAGMAFAEESSGPLAMILLVLSIPYLRMASAPVATCLTGIYPEPGVLGTLWGIAAAFTGVVVGLASLILE